RCPFPRPHTPAATNMHRIPPPPHKMHRPFRYRACIPATAARTSPRPEDRTEQTPSGTAPYEFPTDGYLPAARDRKTDARISGHSVICVPEHTERGYLLYPDSAQSDQRLPVRSEPQKQRQRQQAVYLRLHLFIHARRPAPNKTGQTG